MILTNRCRMCLRHTDKVLELSPTPIANNYAARPDEAALRWPLDLQQCRKCKHIQIGYTVPGKFLFKGYAYRTPEAMLEPMRADAQALSLRYTGRRVLEIGSNNGLNLQALRGAGFTALGIDPACGDDGIPEFFSSKLAAQIARSNSFDLIVSRNTFAHVDDLRDLFTGIMLLLGEGGAVVFDVQYAPAMAARGAFDMIYHEHKDYHTLAPWARFLRGYGLRITDYEMLAWHGGSVRIHAQRRGMMVSLPDETINWGRFKAKIDAEGKRLRAACEAAAGANQVIAFGATAKACTLIHHYRLAPFIGYAVDSTPEKQGKYIPGTAIKILAPDAVMSSKSAKTLLLTAWNFEAEASAQFPDYPLIVPFALSSERLAA